MATAIQNDITQLTALYVAHMNSIAPEGYQYSTSTGRRYTKVIMTSRNGQMGVHSFIDRNTGAVYKPASWASPAKGARYNLLVGMHELISQADWAGGYLYAR